ncbi:hypothetical protein FEE59_13685 [Herbaspirillum sp. RU 5E]|nr:hypothetical protein [Herbaspirillum sp. RU 5E]
MKMLTEDQLRDLMGKAYMRGRTDQMNYRAKEFSSGDDEATKLLHRQMDAEAAQVERIIAGL